MKLINLFLIFYFLSSCSSHSLKSSKESVEIFSNGKLIVDKWNLSEEYNTDIYFENMNSDKHTVKFKTDLEEKDFIVTDGSVHDFNIVFKGKEYKQRIIGEKVRPKVTFSSDYIKRNKGEIDISIPMAYELINIAIAISDYGKNKEGIVVKDTEYYKRVLNWFDKYSNHQFVKEVNILCQSDIWGYFNLKMSGYSVKFDGENLKRSEIFGSTSFQQNNILKPYIKLMESFAKESKFHTFYNENKIYYQGLENYFITKLNIKSMIKWLEESYPNNKQYDYINIIFSPLVKSNQSLVTFSDNNFKELQPHVNFPFKHFFKGLEEKVSSKAIQLYRGMILFTEINHGYADLESSRYEKDIIKATSNRKVWGNDNILQFYPNVSLFNEYMNWALVALIISDLVDKSDTQILIARVKEKMVENRGFYKFNKFIDYLLPLYKNRSKGKTLASLYPQIISWFKKNNEK